MDGRRRADSGISEEAVGLLIGDRGTGSGPLAILALTHVSTVPSVSGEPADTPGLFDRRCHIYTQFCLLGASRHVGSSPGSKVVAGLAKTAVDRERASWAVVRESLVRR